MREWYEFMSLWGLSWLIRAGASFSPEVARSDPALRASMRLGSRARPVSQLSNMFSNTTSNLQAGIDRAANDLKLQRQKEREEEVRNEIEKERMKALQRKQQKEAQEASRPKGKWYNGEAPKQSQVPAFAHVVDEAVSRVRSAFADVALDGTRGNRTHPPRVNRRAEVQPESDSGSWETDVDDFVHDFDENALDTDEDSHDDIVLGSRANIKPLSMRRMQALHSRFQARQHSDLSRDPEPLDSSERDIDAEADDLWDAMGSSEDDKFGDEAPLPPPAPPAPAGIHIVRQDPVNEFDQESVSISDDDVMMPAMTTKPRPSWARSRANELTSGFYRVQRQRRLNVASDDDDDDDDDDDNIPDSLPTMSAFSPATRARKRFGVNLRRSREWNETDKNEVIRGGK